MSLPLSGILMLLLALGLVVFGPLFVVFVIVRRVRWRGGRCAWCGYDLGERVGLVCPECGLGEMARRGRANRRLAGRLVLGGVLPTAAGVVLIGMVPTGQVWPMVWSVMPNDVVIRFSFGAWASEAAREELEERIFISGGAVVTGGASRLLIPSAMINQSAFTPSQWQRMADAILDDIERLDSEAESGGGAVKLSYANWLHYIPSDEVRIRQRLAAFFEHGGPSARSNASRLMYANLFLFDQSHASWTMDDRLCSVFVDVMLHNPNIQHARLAARLFWGHCRCDFTSLERYLREATDERISQRGLQPSMFFRYSDVFTVEEAQGMFSLYERLREDEDPMVQRFRQSLDFGYEFYRSGVLLEQRLVDGALRMERWPFTPITQEELDGESVGEPGGG